VCTGYQLFEVWAILFTLWVYGKDCWGKFACHALCSISIYSA